MTDVTRKPIKPSSTAKNISSVFASPPTLPGESAEQYQHGLQSVIEELEAKTVMQVYLAEKIFECLWWMRRYEQQKRAILAREMGRILGVMTGQKMSPKQQTHPSGHSTLNTMTADEVNNMEIVLDPDRRSKFKQVLEHSDHTEQSLMHEAFSQKSERISALDKNISVFLKNLSGFQASYEVLVNRKLNIERVRMQNELLSREIDVIDMEALPDASQS